MKSKRRKEEQKDGLTLGDVPLEDVPLTSQYMPGHSLPEGCSSHDSLPSNDGPPTLDIST